MRRLLLVFLGILLCCQAWASSEDETNIRFSPIGLLVGAITVNADFKVDPSWTVGPVLSYWHLSIGSDGDFATNYEIKAYGVGVRANWFANGAYNDGWYVAPSLRYAYASATTTLFGGSPVSGSVSALYLGALGGYGWFWNSFNMMLGLGFNVGLGETTVSVANSSGNQYSVGTSISGLDFEYSLGWTF